MKKNPEGWRLLYSLAVLGGMVVIFVVLAIRNGLPSSPAGTRSAVPLSLEDPRAAMTRAISKHMALPSVLPEVEQVEDPEVSRSINPIFYQDAEAGDWVLRYPTIVLLYRSPSDKIIATMPVASTAK